MRYLTLRNGVFTFFLTLALLVCNLSSTAQICGYYYRKSITINGPRIVGGPHTNFPALISHTDAALATAAGKVTSANGFDIIFSDAAGNPLDFQLEQYNGTTGKIVAWVKIPSITNGTDVTIYMNYGNSTVVTNQSNTNTWSAGYQGVWHFGGNVTDGSANNYTSNNNFSTDQASGKIGNARNFATATSWVELTTFPNLTTNFTISGWIYTSDRTRAGQRIFVDDVNNTGGYGFSLGDGGAGILRFYSRASNPVFFDTPALINNNTWYHVAAVADITGNIKRIYIDGVQQGSGAYVNAWGTDAGNSSIGGETNTPPAETGNRFDGRLDEIRVSSNALSANWLATEYRSQNQPTTTVGVVTANDFYTVSATETSYGNPAEFGTNVWNAYAYNGIDVNNALNSYRGFYQHNTLSFNSSDRYLDTNNPSTATGYLGCAVDDDFHTVRYKRAGFPCGYYQVDIAGPGNISGHNDNADLYINGVSVWNHNGCCDSHTGVWSGVLGPNSTVEFRWRESVGQGYGRVTMTAINFPTLTPAVTICAGSTTTLTASGASNYLWTPNTTYITAPYTNPSVVVAPPSGAPNSVQTYTVQTTDATAGCALSNSVDVTINPLPATAVGPTSPTACLSVAVDVTATGANTYTWSPMTGVTVTSMSGNTATLAPATTTTYTVTGNNNCGTNTATITVTGSDVTGDPNQFGLNQWNVYSYSGDNFQSYYGYYVQSGLDFDSRNLWDPNTTPSNAPGFSGCPVPTNNHSYRYKRGGFPCGYYQLDIPNHDDNVVLYVNGVNVFQQDSWYANTYKANVWQGYLDTNSTIEYTIREFAGGSNAGLAFIYLGGPQNGTESVWVGTTDTNWFTSANWCGGVPSSTISAYIPPGATNFPTIGAGGAQTLNLTILSGATLTVAAGQSLASYGNWINDGTFSPLTGSSVVFSGSNASALGGSSTTTFANVQINNSNASALTLSSDITITGSFTFTNGDIVTGSNMVVFNDNATATGMSNSSYVSGLVRKIGNDAFTFPVGKNGYYAPISITNPNNVAYYFTAEYFNADPDGVGYTATSLGAGLNHVSRCEYWTLDRNPNPSSNEQVFVSWDTPRSCGVDDLTDMRIAGWNGTTWTDLGDITSGNTTLGTVRSTGNVNVSNYAAFTLASSTTDNPLPIELLEFKARFVKSYVAITWKTATELNNDFFTIEKSLDGKKWQALETIDGAGNSNVPLSYSYNDAKPNRGIQYYRLTQTDYDGTSTTSNIISVNVDENWENDFIIYPNPTNDEVTITIRVDKKSFLIKLMDINGRVAKEFSLVDQNEITFPVSTLPKGVYIVEVISEEGTNRARLVLD